MPKILKTISQYIKLLVALIAVFCICMAFGDQVKVTDTSPFEWLEIGSYNLSFNEVFFNGSATVFGFIGYLLIFAAGIFALLSFYFVSLNKGNKLILTMNSLMVGLILVGVLLIINLPLMVSSLMNPEVCEEVTSIEDLTTSTVCYPMEIKYSGQLLSAIVVGIIGFAASSYIFIVEFPYQQNKETNQNENESSENTEDLS
ncbi:MAG: hypothetical protein LUD22_00710 [Coprobacillus sp.]|nr:hypothetical protein [Coprobacillus sp.]